MTAVEATFSKYQEGKLIKEYFFKEDNSLAISVCFVCSSASSPARKGILCVLNSSQPLSTSKQLSYPVLGQYGGNPISNLNISDLDVSNLSNSNLDISNLNISNLDISNLI